MAVAPAFSVATCNDRSRNERTHNEFLGAQACVDWDMPPIIGFLVEDLPVINYRVQFYLLRVAWAVNQADSVIYLSASPVAVPSQAKFR